MIKRHGLSIKNAFNGVIWAFRTQPNYIIHLCFSLIAIFASWFLKIDMTEFIIIIMLIFIGFVVETINTGIEATTDAIDREIRQDIKIAKDVSAASMLIYALGSIIIASVIFLPKIFSLFY